MEKQAEEELMDPRSWDFDRAVKRTGGASSRTVLSVAFPRADFERVTRAAEALGKKVSEFVRESAVEKATHQAQLQTHSTSFNHAGVLFTSRIPSTTLVSGREVETTEWTSAAEPAGAR